MNSVLICESKGRGPIKNIGDYIQSIAQKQFWEGNDEGYLEREELKLTRTDIPINVIMNGWFMWEPTQFPPPSNVNPFYISFHLTPSKEAEFFTDETISHLKKHEPIGARDLNTMQLMQKYGIKSYFSGCLTLTLNKTYYNQSHNGGVIFCEPFIEMGATESFGKIMRKIKAAFYWVLHPQKMQKLYRRYSKCDSPTTLKQFIFKMLEVSCFYQVYSERFSDDILFTAEYVSHLVDNYITNQEKFKIADNLLRKYSEAKLVVTSRIHAGLPCLAFETPTVFITSKVLSDTDTIRMGGRFGGLLEFFNYYTYYKGVLSCDNNSLPNRITLSTIPSNPNKYKEYQVLLKREVQSFVENCKV